MSNEKVILDKENGVATITLNRPERMNALDEEMMLYTVDSVLAEAANDQDVKAIIITGAGKAFCVGDSFIC